jgi:hypothetical protein
MAAVNRRQFFSRAAPATVAVLLATGGAAVPGAAAAPPPPATADISARDLRRMSRSEVQQALRRIAARRRAR